MSISTFSDDRTNAADRASSADLMRARTVTMTRGERTASPGLASPQALTSPQQMLTAPLAATGAPVLRCLLWMCALSLCGLGLVMVASTTAVPRGGAPPATGMLIKQALAMGFGLFVALSISLLGVRNLGRNGMVLLGVAGAVAALLVVLAVGREINGARRWIDLGPINVQPAELAKFALVLAVAWHFSRLAESVRSLWYGVLVPLLGFGVLAGLVFATKDLGTVVVMFVIFAGVVAWSGANWLYLLFITVLMLPMAFFKAVFSESYRWERMIAFTDPFAYAHTPAGYHLVQSAIAIGSGGIWGVGLGQSTAKLGFLPERHTDFIYAVICEELGLTGGLGVAAGFLGLILVGLLIAHRAGTLHGRLLALGATLALGSQAFWNMLVACGAVPTKGLTLPFISYGGSSIVICLGLIGILDAVARATPARPARTQSDSRIGAKVRSDKRLRWDGPLPAPQAFAAAAPAASVTAAAARSALTAGPQSHA